MKKIINNIKEFMGNKRKKALVSLLFWILFFAIVIMMIGKPPSYTPNNKSNTVEKKNNQNGIDNFKNIKSFEYTYTIDILENNSPKKYIIKGTYFDNKEYFNMNNREYYSSDNKVYYVDNNSKKLLNLNSNNYELFNIFDINLLLKDGIYSTISFSNVDTKTSYKDGTTIIKYIYTNYNNKEVIITIKEKDGIINNIELDYSKYYDINKYQKFIITCELTNHDNILEYNNKYDGYIIEGE